MQFQMLLQACQLIRIESVKIACEKYIRFFGDGRILWEWGLGDLLFLRNGFRNLCTKFFKKY